METSQLPGPTSWLPLSWAFLENLCSLWGWWHQAKEQIPSPSPAPCLLQTPLPWLMPAPPYTGLCPPVPLRMLRGASRGRPGLEPCLGLAGCQAPGPQAPLLRTALPATACLCRSPGELSAPLASSSRSRGQCCLFGRGVTKEELGASLNQTFSRVSNLAQLR